MFARLLACILVATPYLTACAGPNRPGSEPVALQAAQSSQVAPPTASSRSGYLQLFAFGTPSGSCADGALPFGSLISYNGVLYGTTYGGGANGGGTIFAITKNGSERVLYSFTNKNKYGGYGGGPQAGLVVAHDALYGTTPVDGDYDAGTVFAVSVSGERFTTLHSFGAPSDGNTPVAKLLYHYGELYGTASQGGAAGDGVVFGVDARTGAERILHSFAGSPGDGRQPEADLIAARGSLYGTTTYGGTQDAGTVFSVDIETGAEKVLYSFNGADGLDPQGGLLDVDGTLYGTTAAGGTSNLGTVFAVQRSGNERVLHSFANSPDGANPRADLIAAGDTLYGTTAQGGSYGNGGGFGGTLYSIATSTGKERVVHSFGNGTDGADPVASVVGAGSRLYGATPIGGPNFSSCVTSGGNTVGTVFVQHVRR